MLGYLTITAICTERGGPAGAGDGRLARWRGRGSRYRAEAGRRLALQDPDLLLRAPLGRGLEGGRSLPRRPGPPVLRAPEGDRGMMTPALEILVLSGLAGALGWGVALVGLDSRRPASALETATLREDRERPALGNDAALANAPLAGAGYYKVPKVIER